MSTLTQVARPGRQRGVGPSVREVCLLVALYAGIPAANDAHRIALETLRERGTAA